MNIKSNLDLSYRNRPITAGAIGVGQIVFSRRSHGRRTRERFLLSTNGKTRIHFTQYVNREELTPLLRFIQEHPLHFRHRWSGSRSWIWVLVMVLKNSEKSLASDCTIMQR
jgi:hypothetical protein